MPTTISANFTKFDVHNYNLNAGVHNLTTGALKAALTNVEPLATNETLSQITQISGGGYTAGGYAVTTVEVTKQDGVSDLIVADLTITAGSGGTGNFRYVVIYNDTPTSPADPLIVKADLGAEYSLAQGQTLVINFDQYLTRSE